LLGDNRVASPPTLGPEHLSFYSALLLASTRSQPAAAELQPGRAACLPQLAWLARVCCCSSRGSTAAAARCWWPARHAPGRRHGAAFIINYVASASASCRGGRGP